MLRASLKKIKWARNILAAVTLAAIVLIAGAVLLFVGHSNQTAPYTLRLTSHTYRLEAATTPAEQEKGLGGRQGMAVDHGMVFVFGVEGRQCFWMKDTHFPLDMIWASSTKKVTAVENTVEPDTYPTVFCHPGRYVIELNAGAAALNKLSVGQQLHF